MEGAMARWHFYVMGLIATVWGVVGMAEYVLVSYGIEVAWLNAYPTEQLTWLESLPAWVHGLWGVQAVLALVGALCLLAHVRAAVWMLGLSFVAFLVLAVWANVGAAPPVWAMAATLPTVGITALLVLLTMLLWLYARWEKRHGDVF